VCVAVFAGAAPAPEAWRVLISTGLEDRASLLLWGRDDDEAAGCGVLCGPVGGCSAVDAMVGRLSVAMQSGKRASCERPNEWLTRTQAGGESNGNRHRRGKGEKKSERERGKRRVIVSWDSGFVLGAQAWRMGRSAGRARLGGVAVAARLVLPFSAICHPQSTNAATTIRRLR